MPQARDVNDSIVKSCDDSTAKMNYISLDTIKGTKDTSTSLSRSNDEKDEVVLFDASGIWSTIPARQRALLSSLQVPIEQLPRRSSPLPSFQGDSITEPNLSQIDPTVADGPALMASSGKWDLWNFWSVCVAHCFRQCGLLGADVKNKYDDGA